MAGIIGVIANELLPLVKDAAPILASTLGSPFAGVAVSLLSNAFGVNSDDTRELAQAISNDPNAKEKLAQLELQHKENLLSLANQGDKQAIDDRENARETYKELTESGYKDYVPNLLAIIFVFIYAFIQYHCTQHQDPADDIISARVQDIMVMIISFFFGSSSQQNRVSK